jgi:hypothetical protein
MWTGLYPDRHNVWTEFHRRPIAKPALTSLLAPLPGRFLPRALAFLFLAGIQRMGMASRCYFGIPPRIQSHFDRDRAFVTFPGGTFRSAMGPSPASVQYLAFDGLTARTQAEVLSLAGNTDTTILCIAELDHAGHRLGPQTDAFGIALEDFDRRLAALMQSFLHRWPDLEIWIFSDHGMTPVTETFDVWKYLERAGYRLGQEYLGFIHSTMMSLWFEGAHRDAILAALNRSGRGRVLAAEEKTKYHIHFSDRRFGDDFFLADEGVEFIPNFLSLARTPDRGMHGYDPECASTRPFLIGKAEEESAMDVLGIYRILSGFMDSTKQESKC